MEFGEVETWGRKRAVKPTNILPDLKRPWPTESSTLRGVQKWLSINLIDLTSLRLKQSQAPVVVDWGCARGVAINKLAQKFPKVKAHGFSDVSYQEWLSDKKAKYIFSKHNLFRRYFKKESVDILFSKLGVYHLGKRAPQYIEQILPVLKVGGGASY